MRNKTALLNVFIAVFTISIPGIGTINNFMNILLAAYVGVFTVAFVYDNLTEPINIRFLYKLKLLLKLLSTFAFIFVSPVLVYAYLWQILAPVGFNQILVLLVLASLFYIPLVIVAWIIFLVALALLGID